MLISYVQHIYTCIQHVVKLSMVQRPLESKLTYFSNEKLNLTDRETNALLIFKLTYFSKEKFNLTDREKNALHIFIDTSQF